MTPARWPGPVNPEPDRRARPADPTLADAIVAAIMAGTPGALGWDDPGATYIVVTDVDIYLKVDTRPGGNAETVRSFAQRVEFGTLTRALAALADVKAAALRADGFDDCGQLIETWAAQLRGEPTYVDGIAQPPELAP